MSAQPDGPKRSLNTTRRLTPRAALPFTERLTQGFVPWMGVLRVAGSEKNIEFQVNRGVTLGRRTHGHTEYPHIDLTEYGARDSGVSRLHASITVRETCLSIQDLGSTNGTFLNGYTIQPFVDVPLENEDVIELGNLELKLIFLAPVPDEAK
jgi:hypothetical protein